MLLDDLIVSLLPLFRHYFISPSPPEGSHEPWPVCTQALALNRKGTTNPPVINEANRTGRGTWVTMHLRTFARIPFSFFSPRNARSSLSERLFLGASNQRCSRHHVLNPESLPGIMAFYDKIHNSADHDQPVIPSNPGSVHLRIRVHDIDIHLN